MSQSRKCTATNAVMRGLLLWVLWAASALAWAAPVAATVVQLSGPLLAKKANGSVKVLTLKSEVENGDTLVTEKNTYAMLKFIDNSEMTLRPGTTMTVENFSFDSGKQDDDKAQFALVKGGLRSVTGLLGKRSKEKFELKTPAATIGIRGTTFIAEYIEASEPAAIASAQRFLWASTASLSNDAPLMLAQLQLPSPSSLPKPASLPGAPVLPPGLYVQVIDGLINVSNKGGAQQFSAGQFGFTPSPITAPVIVPKNPGLQFTLPPAFSAPPPVSGTSSASKSNAVDCEVR